MKKNYFIISTLKLLISIIIMTLILSKIITYDVNFNIELSPYLFTVVSLFFSLMLIHSFEQAKKDQIKKSLEYEVVILREIRNIAERGCIPDSEIISYANKMTSITMKVYDCDTSLEDSINKSVLLIENDTKKKNDLK